MEALPSFYNNLFGIEITALGIITAGVFVFLQILHSNFSYKDASLYLDRLSLVLYLFVSALTVLLTGTGSLLLSLGTHDFIPWMNLHTDIFYSLPWNTFYPLFLFFLSVTIGLYVMYESLLHLNPSHLLRLHLKRISNDAAKRHLLNRYGITAPFAGISIYYMMGDLVKDAHGNEITEEEKERIAQERAAVHQVKMQEYESMQKEIAVAPDVFEGVIGLLIKAIGNGDIVTIRKGNEELSQKLRDVLMQLSSRTDDDYSVKAVEYLGRFAGELLKIFIEACRRNNLLSLAPSFVQASRALAISLTGAEAYGATKEMLKSWKSEADIAIASSDRLLFIEIVRSYQEVADAVFEIEGEDAKGLLEEAFRHMGWLAERLISSKGIEVRPDMQDSDYEDEFGALFNAIFRFEHKYDTKPGAYPLIYFDAVHVLFDSMLDEYVAPARGATPRDNGKYRIKDWLFSCVFAYSSFAEEALNVGNGDGVHLAVINLKQAYRSAQNLGAEEVAKDTLDVIVRLAVRIAAHPDPLVSSSNFTGTPVERLEELFLSTQHRGIVSKSVNEAMFRFGEGVYDKKYAYVKSLGIRMGTNFGFMFDEITGLDYTEDDPRRR